MDKILIFYALDEVLEYNNLILDYKFIDFLHMFYVFEVIEINKNKFKIIKVLYLKNKNLDNIIKENSIINLLNGMIEHEIINDIGIKFESIFPANTANKNKIKFYSNDIDNSINKYIFELNGKNSINNDYEIIYKFNDVGNLIIESIKIIK